jgi:hypothetical protein
LGENLKVNPPDDFGISHFTERSPGFAAVDAGFKEKSPHVDPIIFTILSYPLSEATLHYHSWLAVFRSPRFFNANLAVSVFYQSLVRFLLLEFLMGYFRILIRIEAPPLHFGPR